MFSSTQPHATCKLKYRFTKAGGIYNCLPYKWVQCGAGIVRMACRNKTKSGVGLREFIGGKLVPKAEPRENLLA